MSMELRSYITGDNSQYKRMLEATQSQTQVFAGRMGMALSVHTKGARQLATGIMSIGVVAGLAAAAVTGIASVIDLVITRQMRLADAIATEEKRRRDIKRLVEDLDITVKGVERDRLDQIRKQEDAIASLAGRYRELKLAESGVGSWVETAKNIWNYGFEGATQLEALRHALTGETWDAMQKAATAAEDALRAFDRSKEREAGEFRTKSMIDALRLEGGLREAAVLQEGLVTAERRKQIELLTTDAALREKLLQAELRRHQAAMRAIEEEERRRREQAAEETRRKAEEEAREKRRTEDVRARAAFDERSLDAEAARLAGDEKRARLIELEVEHKRRLRDIERNEDLDAETRKRLIDKETANYALRVRAAGEESLRGGGSRGEVRTFAVGQYGSADLIARALGAGESATARRERNEKRQADLLQECRDILARWMAAGNGQVLSGATRALGVN